MSVALLVSSAGLAASLLVQAAMGTTSSSHLRWQPAAPLVQPASELGSNQLTGAQALPVSLSSMVPSYSFTNNTADSAPLTAPVEGKLIEQVVGSEQSSLPTISSLRTTVQRSWHTFKQAFR